jgi:hypothetical protein
MTLTVRIVPGIGLHTTMIALPAAHVTLSRRFAFTGRGALHVRKFDTAGQAGESIVTLPICQAARNRRHVLIRLRVGSPQGYYTPN